MYMETERDRGRQERMNEMSSGNRGIEITK